MTSSSGSGRSPLSWSQRVSPGCLAIYREIESDKGHDAFLVEWDQLTTIIEDAFAADATDATADVDEEVAIAASA